MVVPEGWRFCGRIGREEERVFVDGGRMAGYSNRALGNGDPVELIAREKWSGWFHSYRLPESEGDA